MPGAGPTFRNKGMSPLSQGTMVLFLTCVLVSFCHVLPQVLITRMRPCPSMCFIKQVFRKGCFMGWFFTANCLLSAPSQNFQNTQTSSKPALSRTHPCVQMLAVLVGGSWCRPHPHLLQTHTRFDRFQFTECRVKHTLWYIE